MYLWTMRCLVWSREVSVIRAEIWMPFDLLCCFDLLLVHCIVFLGHVMQSTHLRVHTYVYLLAYTVGDDDFSQRRNGA